MKYCTAMVEIFFDIIPEILDKSLGSDLKPEKSNANVSITTSYLLNIFFLLANWYIFFTEIVERVGPGGMSSIRPNYP